MTNALKLALACGLLASCTASKQGNAIDENAPATSRFSATHEIAIDVPPNARQVRAWLAIPSGADPHQRVEEFAVDSPFPTRKVKDQLGNEFLLVEAINPAPGSYKVTSRFKVARQEVRAVIDPSLTRPHTNQERQQFASQLRDSSQSIIDDDIRRLAQEAVGTETNPVLVARLLYDKVLDHVEYHVKDPKSDALKTMKSSGKGSSHHAFVQCTGNCTDIHSLYSALARSRGIPVRAVYGSFFKGPLDGQDKDQSYHCWIEFHAPNLGWIPLDVAVADVFTQDFVANRYSQPRANLTVADGYQGADPALVDYYFGNLDARRVVWHRGRDLVMTNPRQQGAPLLWNPKAYVEVDGKPTGAKRKLSYQSLSAP